MATTPEGKVKALIKRHMATFSRKYGFWPVQTGMGSKTLDSLWCINGRFVAIEAKAPGKWYTPLQEEHAQQIRKAGGLVYLVDGPHSLEIAIRQIGLLCL